MVTRHSIMEETKVEKENNNQAEVIEANNTVSKDNDNPMLLVKTNIPKTILEYAEDKSKKKENPEGE